MPRVTRGFKARRRRNKVLAMASGYRGGKHRLYRTAAEAVDRSLCFAYRDRRDRKHDFRRLWIARLSAAAKQNGTTYSRLICLPIFSLCFIKIITATTLPIAVDRKSVV